MSIREELILKVLAKEESIAELAREYGVSRKTVYKWVERYQKRGLTGLVDEPRRPKTWRCSHADMQGRDVDTPSVATVNRVLKQVGLVQRVMRRSSGGWPVAAPDIVAIEPNDLWTVDFKGWWRTGDGTRCEPLTIRDAASRYVFALRLMARTRYEDVRPVFEELFERYDLPKSIQSHVGLQERHRLL